MNEKKIKRYLNLRGLIYLPKCSDWTLEELKEIMEQINFEGEITGMLTFNQDSRGRYIKFVPSKCYID